MATKMIHIHAKCDGFEIFEIKSESKAERRLRQIRNTFQAMLLSKGSTFMGCLVVKTGVLNPELPLR